jgi:phosphoglycolate phosphatase-like HAD superfamily hydrolase
VTARPLAVFDIDGVVADVRHRLRYVEGPRRDWDAFFAAAKDDPPLAEGLARLAELAAGHDIAFLTGRPERNRRLTERWLHRHGIGGYPLHMRGDDDRRPARQLKRAALARIAPAARIAVVVDDDPAVCAELRAAGYRVEQASWMPRTKALEDAQERAGRT